MFHQRTRRHQIGGPVYDDERHHQQTGKALIPVGTESDEQR